jgi:CRISPR-associated protein Csb1
MPIDLTTIATAPRLLFDVPLKPVQGHRFQPTGFPDLGAATYQAGTTDCLLIESAQSMANRLEATIWDEGANALIPDMSGLSYVRVNKEGGQFLTASIIEAHRLNSVYVEKADAGKLHKEFAKLSNYSEKEPVDRAAFVKALLRYDVNSLIHGTFLESIGGRLRIPRALSAFIEADGISVAASGGVKNDRVMPGKEEGREAKDGYGNVPFHREEYTARAITASFNLDLNLIRGYGLKTEATRLIILLSLFKVRSLLDGQLRLRTACDLEIDESKLVAGKVVARKSEFSLPSLNELVLDIKAAIKASATELGGDQAITTVTFAK